MWNEVELVVLPSLKVTVILLQTKYNGPTMHRQQRYTRD
jgi:hypothetical protein